MAATPRPVRRRPRRLVAVGLVAGATLLLTLDQMAASGTPQPAPGDAGSALSAASGAASWARAATGTIVPVTPTHYDTPLHPEQITHPDADSMGSGERAAEAAPVAATRPLAAAGPQAAAEAAPDPNAVPDVNAAPDLNAAPNPISANSAVPQLPGIDVSSHQGPVDWASVAPHLDFVYAKATEGTYYQNADFTNQYEGPYDYGVIRGAYHFAIPSNSSGTAQADYFVAHGGGWSADGLTLPGALDIEYNPYGAECYGLTPTQMTRWITNFVTEYAAKEHAYPVIYSTTNWWRTCTGNTGSFASLDPFWVANYGASGGGPLPNGYGFHTFWQYADRGRLPGDQDVFNGSLARLKVLAEEG